jgi:hypothetical protein
VPLGDAEARGFAWGLLGVAIFGLGSSVEDSLI